MKTLIRIPNLPFTLIFAIFVGIMVLTHTTQAEMELVGDEIPEDMKEQWAKWYPSHLKVFIAVIAYAMLAVYILR